MQNIILISCYMCNEYIWKKMISYFPSDTFRMYQANTNFPSIKKMAENLYQTYKNKKFSIIGVSMGSYVAIELMKLNPKNIDKLVLISGSSRSNYLQKNISQSRKLFSKFKLQNPKMGISKIAAKSMLYNYEDDEAVLNIVKMTQTITPQEVANQTSALLNREITIDILQTINIPTLIIHGKNDQLISSNEAKIMHKKIKNSSLHIIGKTGHLPILDHPKKCAALIVNFLLK